MFSKAFYLKTNRGSILIKSTEYTGMIVLIKLKGVGMHFIENSLYKFLDRFISELIY